MPKSANTPTKPANKLSVLAAFTHFHHRTCPSQPSLESIETPRHRLVLPEEHNNARRSGPFSPLPFNMSNILKATIQAAVLSALSNTLAQFITCYRSGVSRTTAPHHSAHLTLTLLLDSILAPAYSAAPIRHFLHPVLPAKLHLASLARGSIPRICRRTGTLGEKGGHGRGCEGACKWSRERGNQCIYDEKTHQ
jgi:hypothetical protein